MQLGYISAPRTVTPRVDQWIFFIQYFESQFTFKRCMFPQVHPESRSVCCISFMFSTISDLFIQPGWAPPPPFITSPLSPVFYYCTPWCNCSLLSVHLSLSLSILAILPVLLPLCMTQFSSSSLASVFLDYLCTVCLPACLHQTLQNINVSLQICMIVTSLNDLHQIFSSLLFMCNIDHNQI